MFHNNPPFALDDEISHTSSSFSSEGCRKGGPKEARLKRVALLSKAKETDHLYPVKIGNIPRTASTEKLLNTFQEFGEIGDVYIPTNLKDGKPATDFAVIRFVDEKAAHAALNRSSNEYKELEGRKLATSPLSKQPSSFSMGTGYLGITNEPFDDGTRFRPKEVCQQNIALSSCMSRSGYPWGSVRELKFLAPHSPPATLDMYTIKVTGLIATTTAEDLREVFARYGQVGDVTCPKPLLVTQQVQGANCGFAFVRFMDRRDVEKAVKAIDGGQLQIDGQTVSCEMLMPKFWPTEKTRRYY